MKRVGIYATLSFAAAMALTGATASQASAENRNYPGYPAEVTIVFNHGYYGNVFNTQGGTGNTQGGTQGGIGNTQGGTQSGKGNTQGSTQSGTGNTQGGTQGGTDNTQGGTQSGIANTQGGITQGTEDAAKKIATRTFTLINDGLNG
ncbi:hypothetical protein EV284_5105 [Streptomyces sp. BK022]|uniref:hypothetical protein n=1 Tax=Streptomyces sp. BK022 TaxID=2512123 RepID=UPI001029AC29|nr:hypothetical protein [Streptomyces sp. BK022]RZU30148.1 hypothetical protein EV284_5105 [Streptomyces sp. BK022]